MRNLYLTLVLVFATYGAVSGSESRYDGPPLTADYAGPVIVDNSQYLYTGDDMLSFSTTDYLATQYPELAVLRSTIDSWASRVGVHPRVLSAVVHSYFEGSWGHGDRLDKDVVAQLASALNIVFSQESPHPLAASRAAHAAANALGFDLDTPSVLGEARQTVSAPAGGPPLFGYFQPPWEIGDTWSGGGAHGTNHNALDFWGDWVPWGGDTTPYWVSAMQEGVARVWSTCSVSVVHPNGWVTGYYHLDRIQVDDFAPVQRNDLLSNYADNEEQAICDGGFSTGPHVHMSLRYNGTAIPVGEANVDFTAFSHHEGVGDYDTNCSRSWYTHYTQGIVCPNWDQLLNDAPDPITIFVDGFESGSATYWSEATP